MPRDFVHSFGHIWEMLQVWEIQDRRQIGQWLEKLDISTQTWLLSDLRTKFEIQELFLQKKGFFLEDSVLRISDLWKKILLRSHPDYKVITPQAATLHLRVFLRQHGSSLDLPESSENTLMKWMTDLAPLYFHSSGDERLKDWFEQNPEQVGVWKNWWLRIKAAFAYFESKKLLVPGWIPAFLQSVTDTPLYWDKDLFVDLGGQLSYVEAELLHQISRKNNVTIFVPCLATTSEKYSDLLQAYEYLRGLAHEIKKIPSVETAGCQRYFSHFSSTLGSIRQATATIRNWIEEGVPLDRIAVVAPDIESIWPVLAFHFSAEGIPVGKSRLSSLQALVPVQFFLSKLRTLSRNLSTRDLELSYYSTTPELAFERFEALYKNIYDESDYGRFEKMRCLIQTDFDIKTPLSQAQFIFHVSKLSLTISDEEIPNWLEILVRDVLGSFDENFQMPWTDWVSFCESSLSRHEIIETESFPKGVMVTNLMSAHFLKVTHRVFVELSEENLKIKSDRGLLSATAHKISRDLGFWLNHPERNDLEFELEWALQCGLVQDHFYVSTINLTGQIQTPSSVWLKSNPSTESSFQIPARTVLDEVLDRKIDSVRLSQDLGEAPVAKLNRIEIKFLSPSALEDFHKCPFIYFARQTLRLKTFPEIDLDLNRKSTGEALHYLFEMILSKGLDEWSDAQLDRLLEETKSTHFVGVVEGLWPAQKKKTIRICQRFIQFEKDWRKEHPLTERTATEVSWSGDLNGVQVRGRIDRVDSTRDRKMIVLDYKLSSGQLKGAHQWIEKGSFQILFYIQALEKGWAPGFEGEVVAAFYYVVKNFSREIGFELTDTIPGFFDKTSKRNQKMTHEKKILLMQDFEKSIQGLMDRLKAGEILPQPNDEKHCQRCEWRRLCRAPHLN